MPSRELRDYSAVLQTPDLLDCCRLRKATGTQIALKTEFFNSILTFRAAHVSE